MIQIIDIYKVTFVTICKRSSFRSYTRYLKFTEKVSFNIASEASYVYILSVQKFIKNAKKGPFILASFWKPKACGQTELPDRSVLIGQKLVENAKFQMPNFGWFWNTVRIVAKWDIFEAFSNTVLRRATIHIFKYNVWMQQTFLMTSLQKHKCYSQFALG